MGTKQKSESRKSRAPAGETREEAFLRLGKYRVNKCMHALHQLSFLARYPHNDEQAAKIVAAIQRGVDNVKAAFSPDGNDGEAGFTF